MPDRKRKVHQLVLEAFIGPRPPGMVCRHEDCNGLNNHLRNLCWGTPQQNYEDSRRLRRQRHLKREAERYDLTLAEWQQRKRERLLDAREVLSRVLEPGGRERIDRMLGVLDALEKLSS